MASGSDKLQEWIDSNNEQADVIDYLVALGDGGARGDLSSSQADTLRATSKGWATVQSAAGVDDPDRH